MTDTIWLRVARHRRSWFVSFIPRSRNDWLTVLPNDYGFTQEDFIISQLRRIHNQGVASCDNKSWTYLSPLSSTDDVCHYVGSIELPNNLVRRARKRRDALLCLTLGKTSTKEFIIGCLTFSLCKLHDRSRARDEPLSSGNEASEGSSRSEVRFPIDI